MVSGSTVPIFVTCNASDPNQVCVSGYGESFPPSLYECVENFVYLSEIYPRHPINS